MTVEALLKQLYDELKEHELRADNFTHIRDYYYKLGIYDKGLKSDLLRVEHVNEMDTIINTIKEIEKRVSK